VLAACQELETSDKIFKVLEDFPGLPHRMENLGLKDGVLYINDSKATTIPSVIEACHTAREKLSPGATLHLLLGGRDKNLNWEALKALRTFEAKTKFYFFGEAREKIRTASGLRGLQFNKMFDAVQAAKQAAKCSDIVLLSPGGTSHDEFLSFEDRGKQFKNLIANF
jgi:UDP-N-acetylmuramoylalanine--D-glutamate ligase